MLFCHSFIWLNTTWKIVKHFKGGKKGKQKEVILQFINLLKARQFIFLGGRGSLTHEPQKKNPIRFLSMTPEEQ